MSEASGAQFRPQYIEMRGHHYHPSGKNYLPSDESEHRRTRAQHKGYKVILDGQLLTTKITSDIRTVVDVGSGPIGLWAKEFAETYPDTQLVGVDIESVHLDGDAPPNLRFIYQDAERPWDIEAESVDFVHMRDVTEGIRDWPALLTQAFRALRPGGLLEMSDTRQRVYDFDGTFAETGAMVNLVNTIHETAEKLGLDLDPVPSMPQWLDDVGFEKVVQRNEILPIGNWPQDEKLKKRADAFNDMLRNHHGFENRLERLFMSAGYTDEQLDEWLEKVKTELATSESKMYGTM